MAEISFKCVVVVFDKISSEFHCILRIYPEFSGISEALSKKPYLNRLPSEVQIKLKMSKTEEN